MNIEETSIAHGGDRNPVYDILRIAACLMVFICHAWIVSTSEFGLVLSANWQMFLKTPAWAGVWIFMVMSGFFSGQHWNRQELSKRNIIVYYVTRAVKVLVPTYGFIVIVYILHEPQQFLNVNVILRMLTLTFNGSGGAGTGIGATWYVFSLFWFICYLLFWNLHGKRYKKEYKQRRLTQ